MKPLTKTFLALSIVLLLIGFIGGGTHPLWDLPKPLGAVFFVLFYIFFLLEKESDLFLADEAAKSHLNSAPDSLKPNPIQPVKPTSKKGRSQAATQTRALTETA